MNAIHFRRAALAIFVLLGSAYAWLVPVGEAPDEPAHLAVVDHLVRERALPSVQPDAGPLAYESYQPPLDYLVSAGLLQAFRGRAVEYPFAASPDLDFHRPGSRAFLPRTGSGEQARAIRWLRIARLFWGALTVFFVCRTARLVTSSDTDRAIYAVAPFVFCPQLLFNAATINNDGAVTALSSAAIHGLCRLVSMQTGQTGQTGEADVRVGVGTGIAAGLALWSKASGLFLALPLLVVSAVLARQRRGGAVAGLLLSFLPVAAGWLAFAVARSGPFLLSSDPGSAASPGLSRLMAEPAWPVSIWISFWGKFGWLNLRLPDLLYLLFVPPTVLAAAGMFAAARRRGQAANAVARVALLAFAANLALLVGYLVKVSWQLQGRFLLPSIAALASLAVAGLGSLGARPRIQRFLAHEHLGPLAALLYAAVGALGAWWIARAY